MIHFYNFSLFLVADLEDEGRNAIDGPASPSQESIDPSAFLLGKTAFNLLVGKMSWKFSEEKFRSKFFFTSFFRASKKMTPAKSWRHCKLM